MARKKPTLLLDADVLCHQFAYLNTESYSFDGETFEALNPEKARVNTESYILRLKREMKAGDVKIILSDREANFRKQLDETYKSKRKPKPKLWYEVRDFLESGELDFERIVYSRLEGDDVMGLLATNELKGKSIIVSIDKDMKTVPGLLFNPNKPDEGVQKITPLEATRFHARQTLEGDSTDGYPGLRGCGPVTAAALLDPCETEEEIWKAVVGEYERRGSTKEAATHQARLAFILRDDHYNKETNRIKLWKMPI